jgi:hypothetical protein
MKSLKFSIIEGHFTIHRLKPGSAIPKGVTASPFYSISGSAEELTIVAPDVVWMESEKADPDWSCLKVNGPLDFDEIGILSGITTALAKAEISVFAVSTFDTDYILVKHEKLQQAKEVLSAEGHKFARPPARSAFEEVRTTPTLNAYAAMIERHVPLIKSLLLEKVGEQTLATMKSEAALFAAVGGLYEFMPPPVKLLVNQDLFVGYTIKNLERILPEVSVPARKKIVKKPR